MKRILVLLLVLAMPMAAFAHDIPGMIHGNDYSELGFGYVYWNVNDGKALVLPFSSDLVWGDKTLFVSSGWRVLWGNPDFFNVSYGYKLHFYPFQKYPGLGLGAYLGTFFFMSWTLLVQPSVSVEVPVSPNGFVALGTAYDLEGIALPFSKQVGYLDGWEFRISSVTKF